MQPRKRALNSKRKDHSAAGQLFRTLSRKICKDVPLNGGARPAIGWGCVTFAASISEDGQDLDGLVIVNPFDARPSAAL